MLQLSARASQATATSAANATRRPQERNHRCAPRTHAPPQLPAATAPPSAAVTTTAMVESASCINPPPHRAVPTKAHRGQGNDARHILARICAAICSQGTSDCPPLHAAAARGQQTTYCNTSIYHSPHHIPVHAHVHPWQWRSSSQRREKRPTSDRLNSSETVEAGNKRDHYGLLFATDLWGLTAGKVDQSVHCVGKSVTFVHWEVRSTAGGRLLS